MASGTVTRPCEIHHEKREPIMKIRINPIPGRPRGEWRDGKPAHHPHPVRPGSACGCADPVRLSMSLHPAGRGRR
ncbi:hypothetical protein [Bifidobacterium reuteri]|uniref:hypothetical protein n=2 Tax=Bifidobacterium TaxID=1678 RepID=UPI001377B49F|nr:hypothetical protein [Bifidobacterium reuteri]